MEKKQYSLKSIINSILLIAITLTIFACSSDKAKLSFIIEDLKGELMTIEEQRVSGAKFISAEEISPKGKANYEFEIDQPKFYNLRIENGKDIFLLLHPQDRVKISGTSNKPVIEGSPDSEKLNLLYDSLFVTRNKLSDLKRKYQSANVQDKEEFSRLYNETYDEYYRFSLQFILDNLTSIVSIAAIYQEVGSGEYLFGGIRDIQYFKLLNDSLSKYYPKHRHVLALQRNFNQMMESYQLEKLIASADIKEENVPNLKLPSVNGDSISLLPSKSRYILVNFWTNYMQGSDNYIPQLKKVFDKYGNRGFDIYNVYVGKSYEAWKKAIDFEEIDKWTNVADTNFPFSVTKAKYNVTSLPSNYFLDLKNEVLLGKNVTADQLNRALAIKLD